MKISAVIPANNEMHSVGDVVLSCKAYSQEVIVVDDGSTDDTAQLSQAAGAKVIRKATNLGLVKSTQIGLRAASGDIIVTLDADGQHDPSDIPNLIKPIISGNADLVLEKRDEPPPLSERLIARLVGSHLNCSDVGTGFRAFRRELAENIRLRGFCLCGSLVLEAHRRGGRIVEVPTRIQPRKFGESHWASSRARVHFQQTIILLFPLLKHYVAHRFLGNESLPIRNRPRKVR